MWSSPNFIWKSSMSSPSDWIAATHLLQKSLKSSGSGRVVLARGVICALRALMALEGRYFLAVETENYRDAAGAGVGEEGAGAGGAACAAMAVSLSFLA